MMKKEGRADKIAVIVGAITDDIRIHKLPKMKVIFFFDCPIIQLMISLQLSSKVRARNSSV